MQRYLIKFAYSGILFRGLQRQPGEILTNNLIQTASIQTILEKGFEILKPLNKPIVHFSSRTDKGVHSFCNLAHVDLQKFAKDSIYQPQEIRKTLNKFFSKQDISLLVTEVHPVPNNFHARFSSFSREYIYRIGVTKSMLHPIVEWRRCHFVPDPFDFEKAAEASKLFEGTRDFATFCHGLKRLPEGYPTVRTLDQFTIKPGAPLFNPTYDPLYDGIVFYEIHAKANAFMYKQVRRMVSVIIAVAQNRMSIDEVHLLFDQPGNWNSKASTVPAYGLYLINVKYTVPSE